MQYPYDYSYLVRDTSAALEAVRQADPTWLALVQPGKPFTSKTHIYYDMLLRNTSALINNGAGYNIGDTAITTDNEVGTFVAGDTVVLMD